MEGRGKQWSAWGSRLIVKVSLGSGKGAYSKSYPRTLVLRIYFCSEQRVTEEYMKVAQEFGFTLSIQKKIESVSEFGSIVSACGKSDTDISGRIAQVSKAFGAFKKSGFMDYEWQ